MRRKKTEKSEPQLNKKKLIIIAASISTLILLIILIFYFVFNAFDRQENIVIAKYLNSNYLLLSYDFDNNQLAEVKIPQNVYVESSSERGSWRLESVVSLIKLENLDREVYSNTLMKSFDVPVDHYVFESSSSLNIFQKFRLSIFRLFLPSKSKSTYDLAETSYLTESELPDGENGYLMADELPSVIKQAFVDNNFALNGYRIEIERHINRNYSSSSDLVEILTTMGGHVVNVRREDFENTNCKIYAKENVKVTRLSKIFNCSVEVITEGNLDIRISIGNEFAKRF